MFKTIKSSLFKCVALCAFFALNISFAAVVFAQQGGQLDGSITDANGPVVGAAVFIKGATIGETTDLDGRFSLKGLENGDVVVISLIGYETKEITWTGQTYLDIEISEEATFLEGVVVTAMGVERASESLTYTAETIGGKDVNDIKSVNMINSLQGKSAGMVITPNSTGAGGSSKILFRGNKSISGNNQPLIVVDGVPVMNSITADQVNGNYGGQRDGGDVMSTINPDDIQSITLLKGASASALYGALAANGVVMITTKSASEGRVNVSVSSNTTVDTPMVLPEFQNKYGMDANTRSWGAELSGAAPNYAKEFFRTGVTTNNSISISGGGENVGAYFSYGNVYSEGLTPSNDYMSHSLNAKVNFTVLKNIHVDFSAKYTNQHIENQAASGYLWNPLTGVYLFPRGEDWNGYRDNFEIYDTMKGINVQNWMNTGLEQFNNPYWMLNRMKPVVDRNRYEFGGSIRWDIYEDLYIQGRMRYERGDERFQHNLYATSVTVDKYPMGRLKDNRYFSDQLYGDVLIGYDHTWANGFSLSATVGSSFTHSRTGSVLMEGDGGKYVAPGNGNVYFPNIFNPNNFYANLSKIGSGGNWNTVKRLNAVFGTVQLGFKEGLFLDLTARNDWSSTLAFTQSCSFFYPSAGLSFLLDKFVDLGPNVDLLKFRGSYAMVGNDVPIYMTNLMYELSTKVTGALSAQDKGPFRELKPEMTHSIEAGIDGIFFNNRFNVSATYYKTNTKNQFFAVDSPYESGLRQRYVNAGDVQNQGFELALGWYEPFTPDFSWETNLNLSYNDNKVKELVKELGEDTQLSIANYGGTKILLQEGGSYGDIYVRTIKRDEAGKPVKGDDGAPVLGANNNWDLKYAGNMNSKWNAGWTNTFRYKNFMFSFLIDARFGGKVVSMTEATLDGWGVSARSGAARDAGEFVLDGVSFDPKAWYEKTGSTSYNSEYADEFYVYDATNIRLREVSLGYTFRNVFGPGKNITASIIGRNLFFFYKKAPMDPDVAAGTGNGWQGVDMFALPTTRSFGLNLKLNF